MRPADTTRDDAREDRIEAVLVPRRALLVVAAVVLVLALWGGLVRLGWAVPQTPPELPSLHGIAVTLGFLGTLIALERAAASGRWWAYGAPGASVGGAAVLLLGGSLDVGRVLLLVGGLGLCGVYVWLLRLSPSVHLGVMRLGAAAWVVGVARWLSGAALVEVVPWLAGFLVATIAGERLELGRMRGLTTRSRLALLGALSLLLVGLVITAVDLRSGTRVAGAGLVALAAWLGLRDVARRTIRVAGLTRFMAVALLAGYAWLAVAGALWIRATDVAGGPGRDAALHALFLGFVLSMIFAHVPVILPSVLGIAIAFHPVAYGPLALLHGSLAARVAGDLAQVPWLVRWGGLLNVVAIGAFAIATIAAAGIARRR